MIAETERARLEKLAESITGITTIIRVGETYHNDALGDITRAGTKAVCITIHKKLDFEQAYSTWLHECAHVLLGHHKTLAPEGYKLAPSGRGIDYKVYDTGATAAREDKTNLLVKQMDLLAARMCWGVFGGDSTERKIIMFEKQGRKIAAKSLELIKG